MMSPFIKTPTDWEIEIVYAGDESVNSYKQYDTYSYKDDFNGEITSCNWMSKLPDSMALTDISIPGVHDSVTVKMKDHNHYSQCQQLNIRDLLSAGVRYFDMRFAYEDNRLINENVSELTV